MLVCLCTQICILVAQVWNLTIKIPMMKMQVNVPDFEQCIICQEKTTNELDTAAQNTVESG